MILDLGAPQEISEEKRTYYSEVIKNDPYNLELLPPEARDDKDLAIQVVESAGYALKDISSRLKDDEEVALAAMRQCPTYYVFAQISDRLKSDKDFVLKCIDLCETSSSDLGFGSRTVFSMVHPHFLDDKEVVLLAVQKRGRDIAMASARLRSDRDIVLAAVKQSGGKALLDLPKSWREDSDVMDILRGK